MKPTKKLTSSITGVILFGCSSSSICTDLKANEFPESEQIDSFLMKIGESAKLDQYNSDNLRTGSSGDDGSSSDDDNSSGSSGDSGDSVSSGDDSGDSVGSSGDTGDSVGSSGDTGDSVGSSGDTGDSVGSSGDTGDSVGSSGDAGDSVGSSGDAGDSVNSNGDAGDSVGSSGDSGSSVGSSGDLDSSYESTAELQEIIGEIITASPIDTQVIDSTVDIDDVSAILTQHNSEVEIQRKDGATIQFKEQTLAIFNPAVEIIEPQVTEKNNIITLIRGELTASIGCDTLGDYTVRTELGTIVAPDVCDLEQISRDSQTHATENAKFNIVYERIDLENTLTVIAILGVITVTDYEGNQTVLTAGQEITLRAIIPHPSWVLPIDNGAIYSGMVNLFTWTAIPQAKGYLLEYSVPNPAFSEENPASVEFTTQTIKILPPNYSQYEDLILYDLPLGNEGIKGVKFEGRIFALDENHNIISGSVSSDRITVIGK